MKVGGIKTWKELMIGVKQLVRLLFNNNFTNGWCKMQVKFLQVTVAGHSEGQWVIGCTKEFCCVRETRAASVFSVV